jgi:hypothetical protein
MRRVAALAALFAMLFTSALCAQEKDAPSGDDIVASLQARFRLLDAQGRPLERGEDRRTVRLSLALSDAQTGRPAADLPLQAWVRPADAGNPSCEAAVRSFRVTRRLAPGSVDLNGILLVTLNSDASVGVIDPKLNLRSSNMLAAHRLDGMPAAIAADPAQMRLLASFPASGEVRALSLHSGQATPLLRGLDRPGALAMAAADHFWLAEEGKGSISRRDAAGAIVQSLPVTRRGTVLAFRPVAADPAAAAQGRAAAPRLGVFGADGALLLVDAESGRILLREAGGESIADAAFLSSGAIFTLSAAAPRATLRFAGRPDSVQQIATGIQSTRLAGTPDGRFAVAYTPGESQFVLIDIAAGRVAQSFQLDSGSVSEVLLTAGSGFVLSHDGGFVAAMDMAALRPGRELLLRRVPLAASGPRPAGAGPFLVSLAPAALVLVVDPERQTGWLMPEAAAASEIPPMDSVRLRGGVPAGVVAVDRAFRRRGPGQYETAWAFEAGDYELVLGTAAGGYSRCIPFQVDGPARQRAAQPVALQVALPPRGLRAGIEQQLKLTMRDRDGQDRTPLQVELLLPSMTSSWRETALARRGADGSLSLSVTFPHAGTYLLQPLDLPAGLVVRAAPLLEVMP